MSFNHQGVRHSGLPTGRQARTVEETIGARYPGVLCRPTFGDARAGRENACGAGEDVSATHRQDCLAMAFGQVSGPPASPKQVRELLSLLQEAGHADFRDARGPMGFTQRQAAGKFTREEATGFINRLQDEEVDGGSPVAVPAWQLTAQEQIIRHVPAEKLAVELRRRGWTVSEPQIRQ